MSTVTSVFNSIDNQLLPLVQSASSGLTSYVLPLVWVTLAVWLVAKGYLIMMGKVQTPGADVFGKLFMAIVLLTFMTQGYTRFILTPAIALPNELISAACASGANGCGPLGVITKLEDSLGSIMGVVLGKSLYAFPNFAKSIAILFAGAIISLAMLILICAASLILLYSKIGLMLVLSVGPLFLFFLLVPYVKSWFNSWLNTLFYFVVLGLLGALSIQLFVGVVLNFVYAIDAANGAAVGAVLSNATLTAKFDTYFDSLASIFSYAFQMVIVCGPFFFLLLQLPTIASSLTQGSGGSAAGGATALFHVGRSLLSGKPAGGGSATSGGSAPAPSTPPPPPPAP